MSPAAGVRLAHRRDLPAQLNARYRRSGLVTGAVVSHTLWETAHRFPRAEALTDLTAEGGPRHYRYQDLLVRVERLVTCWRRAGVRPGEVVLVQTPNCAELVVTIWAGFHAGCVVVPVVDIYREHELRALLAQLRPAALVAMAEDRGFGFAAALDEMLGETAGVKSKIVIHGTRPGWTEFDAALAGEADPADPAGIDPGDPVLVLFTSGTTSAPKGVVHSSASLLAEVHQQRWAKAVGWSNRGYVGVPLAHLAGLLNAVLIPGSVGGSVVLSRMRSLDRSAQEILEHGVTDASGPTTLLDAVTHAAGDTAVRLRRWWTGGMTVSGDQLRRAEALGIAPFRTYGLTEFPTVTQSSELDSARARLETDGRLPPGVECQAVDADRRPLPPGEEGELRVRGPERMIAYLDAASTEAAIDEAGWLYTGDLGVVDRTGCVTVSGRIKDIINRGGEKFSARDIEDVVHRHPAVARAAVVAAPDERFGETPAAFVSFRPGQPRPTDTELAEFLRGQGLARQKVPTLWREINCWPETSLGKVRKLDLLEMLRDD